MNLMFFLSIDEDEEDIDNDVIDDDDEEEEPVSYTLVVEDMEW